jgi:tetratricopeptide (TPR) repeat protein
VFNYRNLGGTYTALNRLDEAEAVYKQAEERKLENEFLLQNRYWLAFLKGDAAQMAQLASAVMGKPGAEDLLLATQADTEGWYGKLKNAHELTGRAMDSARHNDAKERAAAYQAAAALREVESGNREQARAEANAALKLAPNRDVRAMAALALARAGDTAGAEKLAAELDKTFPLDTRVQRYWLPTIRAGVALERKDPNRAIELLKVASTIELSGPTNLAIFLCPAYLRGEAYLMLRDGNAAAGEFQKFIDHQGIVVNFPWGALAHLGLGRAYALEAGVGAGLVPVPPEPGAPTRGAPTAGRPRQSPRRLSGLPHALERRRPGCSDPEGSQGGIRKAEIIPALRPALPGPPAPRELPAARSPASFGSPFSCVRPRCDSVPHLRSCGIDWHTWPQGRTALPTTSTRLCL